MSASDVSGRVGVPSGEASQAVPAPDEHAPSAPSVSSLVVPVSPATQASLAAPAGLGRHTPAPGRPWPTWARAATLGSIAAVTAAVCARVYAVDPAEPGHYPLCPFRLLTTLDCPGCGTARGLHQLLHGNLVGAADYNLFFVIAAPFLVGAWLLEVVRLFGWRGEPPRVPTFLVRGLPVVIVIYWVVRNLPLPGATWLASTPL